MRGSAPTPIANLYNLSQRGIAQELRTRLNNIDGKTRALAERCHENTATWQNVSGTAWG